MSSLWRGTPATRIRIASGLILFVYALLHFLNIGLGLFSTDLLHRAQDWRQWVTRSWPGGIVLYGAFAAHIGLALTRLAARRTLQMPLWEWVQVGLGLIIPMFLIVHVVHTRVAHEVFAVNDEMSYIMLLIFGRIEAFNQSLLLLIVWIHGCVGLHFWLRGTSWWSRWLPALIGFAVLVPAFALAGFLVEGRRITAAFADETQQSDLFARYNWPFQEDFLWLEQLSNWLFWGFIALLGLVAAIYVGRTLIARRSSVRISYVDGPRVTAAKGLTLLEMSRSQGVPHTSLCGGRGRCTTCRVVIEEGMEFLHPPSPAEATSLAAVDAGPNTRLACQIRPVSDTTVFRVFAAGGHKKRAHAGEGEEKVLALLFLDMRGFTARTAGQLPYDVVFLLNRFFDAIVPAINKAGGTVDKYLGDGFLAVFETDSPTSSARAALQAVESIDVALTEFNKILEEEREGALRIGIGAHLGNVVLGEIGAAGQAPRTLIGDTVNTASRLEGITKQHKVQAFISQRLLQAAGYEVPADELMSLELRGRAEPLSALPVASASGLIARLQALRPSE